MPLRITNRDARRLWLAANGLAETPTGPCDLRATLWQLGFVQLDSINVVVRAHHHILWSRNQNYREPMLDRLLARDRAVFEHFTHDASVLPIELYPIWTRQFRRRKARMDRHSWYTEGLEKADPAALVARIAAEGPLCTSAFESESSGPREMWRRPPHKVALDYLWHAGELGTSHRENFTKFYDLTDRVIPEEWRREALDDEAQVSALCQGAIDRLWVATPAEIRKFWEAADPAEVQGWVARARDLVEVEVEAADGGWTKALATPDIETRIASAPAPTSRLRILNPFDPAVRDRDRLARLFGFDYRNEIFVPAAQRRWGYYVMPLLEGDRIVGRLEAKAERAEGRLTVSQLWAEPGVRWTAQRQARLEAELARLARFAGCAEARLDCAAPGG